MDSSATDDQPTRVALQYRVGTPGSDTNVPAAYLTDATVVANTTVTSTSGSAALPAEFDNKADVFLRIITLDNATGSNEHVGIDNISITETSGPLAVTDPGDRAFSTDTPITSFALRADDVRRRRQGHVPRRQAHPGDHVSTRLRVGRPRSRTPREEVPSRPHGGSGLLRCTTPAPRLCG